MESDVVLIQKVKDLCVVGDYYNAIDLTYSCTDPILGIKLHIICISAGNLDNYFKR